MLFHNVLPHTSIMARRAAMEGGYPEASGEFAEDYDLLSRIAREHRMAVIRDELVRYRRHATSVSQVNYENNRRLAAAIAWREVSELAGGELERDVYEDFLAVYRGGGKELPRLSAERVRRATEFAVKLQAAFYARAGCAQAAAWRHCAGVRMRWAGHLLRLAWREPRDWRWRASVAMTAAKLMSAPVAGPAKGRLAMRATQ
jgi:hypothetical protein